ncbi:MAG: cellulase family glycosylhydrolase, partial [Treponema sp.]|nr:cellulase family glycosylhydrolase [Treponema sp.]
MPNCTQGDRINNIAQKRQDYRRFLISALLVLISSISVFAQSVKPYKLDLSKFPASNENKTITFNKKTGKVTIDKHGDVRETVSLFYWLNNMDVSDYNVIRIKYEATEGIGFSLHVSYPEEADSYTWYERGIYCPSYLTEMVFPITAYPKRLEGIIIASPWGASSCQFTIKEITFEKVDDPVYTNIHATDEKPVVDTATKTTINPKADAWDFVPKLGVGAQYWAFNGEPTREFDFGFDFSTTGYPKARRRENFKNLRSKGFKTIRFLVNPGEQFIDDKYTLDPRFVKEIKELVDMAIEEDFYVILCGFFWAWEVSQPDSVNRLHPVRYESVIVNAKEQKRSEKVLKAFWTQIGTAFNNSYDEHLIFETMNEPGDDIHPHVEGHDGPIDPNCSVCKSDIKIGNGYNQLIVDTIRATGGNNANRFLMVAAFGNPWASYFKMPKDKSKNKLIPIAHIYPLGVENNINMLYSEGIKKIAITDIFEQIDKCFFKKHIPFYISEVNA